MIAPGQTIPNAIATNAANFTRDIPGTTVTPEHRGGARWRITVTSPRVTMWVEYETLSRGRLKKKGTQLHIDGKQVPIADSYSRLIRIFADPDNGRDAEWKYPEPQPADIADAPEDVRVLHRRLAKVAAKGNFVLSVHQGGRRWLLVLENDRVQLRVALIDYVMNHLRPGRDTGAGLAKRNPIELIVDGNDLTERVNGNLERALKMMMAHPSAPARPAVAAESDAARTNSVEVRRATVMRN